MAVISIPKMRYHKLDEIGFIGTQGKRSSKQIKLDALRTTRVIKNSKPSGKVVKVKGSSRHRKIVKVTQS
jgi:hypothetical protein